MNTRCCSRSSLSASFSRAERCGGRARGDPRVRSRNWPGCPLDPGQAIEGDGKITIKTFLENEKIIIEFSDTGKGISPENISRIFDSGFTTKGSGEGTGLGLSIVKKIIDEHDGTIEVDSEVQKGTTFRLRIPVQ